MNISRCGIILPRHERPIPREFEKIFARDGDRQRLDGARDEGQDYHKHGMRNQRSCRQLQAGTYHDEGQAEGSDLGGHARPEHVVYIVDIGVT